MTNPRYDKVEDSLMYGVLKRHLDDFVTFLREIKEGYIKRNAQKEQ